ncbi:MAG: hypothetical protein R6U40_07365 [Desulfobacterales bacterium]
MIDEYERNGRTFVSAENEQLFVEFLPEVGGKMTKLLNKKTGTQFLLEPQNEEKSYKQASYGADFEKFDTSGFDECFPTIEESEYRKLSAPEERTGTVLPDHGELWSRPWQYDMVDEYLQLTIAGVQLQYRLTKRISLDGNRVLLDYYLANEDDIPLTYLWSAHPLLRVNPGTKLFFRDNIEEVFVNWASDPDLGQFGDKLPWPVIRNNGQPIDYSVVKKRDFGQAAKFFTHSLNNGLAGIHDSQTDETLLFHFDPGKTPYLGLWLCYGGWPAEADRKHLTVGIEPTNGRPDALDEAVKRRECSEIKAKGTHQWVIGMSLWEGKPDLQHINSLPA